MPTDRRKILAGTAATLAASAFPNVTLAKSVADAQQAPGFYRFKLGDMTLTVVNDGARTFPMPDGFVKNASKDEALAAASAAYMPAGQVTIPFNPVVIDTGGKLVLFDTGNGPTPNAPVGKLMANLKAAGIGAGDIDTVVISHMHPDHINGLKDVDGKVAFPNAEIMVSSPDWAFWMSEENAAKAASPMAKNYFANAKKVMGDMSDRVKRYEPGKEVAPGVTAVEAFGHTPGHVAFAVASGDKRLLVQSDVTNIPSFFLRNPDWHVAFDNDPVMAQATRHKIYDMAAAEKMPVIGYHFSFPSAGYVEKDGAKYRLVPVNWSPVI